MPERDFRIDTPKITLEAISGIPSIMPGDNLGRVIRASFEAGKQDLSRGDVLVVTQKIVSKAEGRYVDIADSIPTAEAVEISKISGRDPRLVQLIINESEYVRWVKEGTPEAPGIIVVKHKLGHTCSGAGIDATNLGVDDEDNRVLLLPEDPDSSAKNIADYFEEVDKIKIGVIVIDTLGDRYRLGSIGKAIGVANIPARFIKEGLKDLDGRHGLISDLALADSLAGMAMVLMGAPDQGSPVVIIRGTEFPISPSAKIRDLFA